MCSQPFEKYPCRLTARRDSTTCAFSLVEQSLENLAWMEPQAVESIVMRSIETWAHPLILPLLRRQQLPPFVVPPLHSSPDFDKNKTRSG